MDAYRIETVRTESFAMDYLRFGGGERAFVILPGLSVRSVLLSAEAIVRQYAPVAERFTVYLFDRRRELPAVYPVEEMAEDTAAAMTALGLRGTALFGASQGGMMALTIAIRRPELVRKLVLGSTTAKMTEEKRRVPEKWIRLAKAGDREGLFLDFGQMLYPPEVFAQYREALIRMAEDVTDEELRRFVILAEDVSGFDVTGALGKIRCPVLTLNAADDRVLGADAAKEIRETLGSRGDFRSYSYDGFGHAAYDTAPDYLNRILDFLCEEERMI